VAWWVQPIPGGQLLTAGRLETYGLLAERQERVKSHGTNGFRLQVLAIRQADGPLVAKIGEPETALGQRLKQGMLTRNGLLVLGGDHHTSATRNQVVGVERFFRSILTTQLRWAGKVGGVDQLLLFVNPDLPRIAHDAFPRSISRGYPATGNTATTFLYPIFLRPPASRRQTSFSLMALATTPERVWTWSLKAGKNGLGRDGQAHEAKHSYHS